MYTIGNIGISHDKDSIQTIDYLIASERLLNVFVCNCSPCLRLFFQSLPLLHLGNAELAINCLDMEISQISLWKAFNCGLNDTFSLQIFISVICINIQTHQTWTQGITLLGLSPQASFQ